LYELA
jgi:cytochrome P450